MKKLQVIPEEIKWSLATWQMIEKLPCSEMARRLQISQARLEGIMKERTKTVQPELLKRMYSFLPLEKYIAQYRQDNVINVLDADWLVKELCALDMCKECRMKVITLIARGVDRNRHIDGMPEIKEAESK